MSNNQLFFERDPRHDNEDSFLDRVMNTKAFDLITRAKAARKESKQRGPLGSVERGDKIPLELLNAAIGYSPEFAELIRKVRRASTPEAERRRRRARGKRARASRQRNQQIMAQARRRRQKHRRMERAA